MVLRMAFALAVESDPNVLLVDEVLAVGDDSFQQQCLERIRSLRQEGCAILIVSHHLEVVRENCRRAIVLEGGRVTFDGASDEALDFYVHSSDAPSEQLTSDRAIYGALGARRRRIHRD
jgi:ABC-type polysaccharide/polyol phosphate transport system ATPase subunit